MATTVIYRPQLAAQNHHSFEPFLELSLALNLQLAAGGWSARRLDLHLRRTSRQRRTAMREIASEIAQEAVAE